MQGGFHRKVIKRHLSHEVRSKINVLIPETSQTVWTIFNFNKTASKLPFLAERLEIFYDICMPWYITLLKEKSYEATSLTHMMWTVDYHHTMNAATLWTLKAEVNVKTLTIILNEDVTISTDIKICISSKRSVKFVLCFLFN